MDTLQIQISVDSIVEMRKRDFYKQHKEYKPIHINWELYTKVLEAKMLNAKNH